MKLRESFSYPAGVEAVFALITDDAFRTKAAEDAKGRDVSATVEKDGDDTVVTITRTQPATSSAVPDFVKKLIGSTVTIKQVERWEAPDADGNRTATVTMKVAGKPAGFTGKAALKADGKGSAFVIVGDVNVDVPFVGKKVEPLVAKAVEAGLRHDVKAGVKRLS